MTIKVFTTLLTIWYDHDCCWHGTSWLKHWAPRLPTAALLFVVGDVLDDVEWVWLPNGNGDLDVLLNWNMDLLDDFVWSVDRDLNFLDDFEWNLFHNLNRDGPLDMDVLSLVHGVWDLLHDFDLHGVGLWHWYSDFLTDRHRYGLRYSDPDVPGHLDGDATNNILHNRLQLVPGSRSIRTTNCNSGANNTRSSNGCCLAKNVATVSWESRVEEKATFGVSIASGSRS